MLIIINYSRTLKNSHTHNPIDLFSFVFLGACTRQIYGLTTTF